MKHMRVLLLLSISFLLFGSTQPEPWLSSEKKYLPKELKKVRFGMSFNELMKLRGQQPKDVSDPDYNFRKVYLEKVNSKGITNVTYYFDNQGNLPLYEMIVVYDSEAARDRDAEKLLGEANYKGKDWKIDMNGGYPLHAWKFKNKLVYAVPLKGSEWEGGI